MKPRSFGSLLQLGQYFTVGSSVLALLLGAKASEPLLGADHFL
jgi:hypothetical protein